MSKEWEDLVFELQSPMGLLFILQMAYEHGEPRWNDVDRRRLLFRQPELSLAILPTEQSSNKSGGSEGRK
jgi:hypothetical protein